MSKKGKNDVVNTAKNFDPFLMLLQEMGSDRPGKSIELQEAEGQTQFVNSDVLPLQMGRHGGRELLEAAGVEFGEDVEGDPLFVNVTLPEGWKKVASDHAMWSDLVDEQGRLRAEIFYKAAFYDRSAHMDVIDISEK